MLKETLKVRLFGRLKVPMIAYARPRIVHLDEEAVDVVIPLGYRTKNHLGSMYFGALSVGADLAAGYMCLDAVERSGQKVSFVFKDVQGNFLRRPTGDVTFRCEDGKAIQALVARAVASKEREEETVNVVCTVPKESDEPVATFALTLSIKARG